MAAHTALLKRTAVCSDEAVRCVTSGKYKKMRATNTNNIHKTTLHIRHNTRGFAETIEVEEEAVDRAWFLRDKVIHVLPVRVSFAWSMTSGTGAMGIGGSW